VFFVDEELLARGTGEVCVHAARVWVDAVSPDGADGYEERRSLPSDTVNGPAYWRLTTRAAIRAATAVSAR